VKVSVCGRSRVLSRGNGVPASFELKGEGNMTAEEMMLFYLPERIKRKYFAKLHIYH
jgi:hypothetical protein